MSKQCSVELHHEGKQALKCVHPDGEGHKGLHETYTYAHSIIYWLMNYKTNKPLVAIYYRYRDGRVLDDNLRTLLKG